MPSKYESSARVYVDGDGLLGPLLRGIAVEVERHDVVAVERAAELLTGLGQRCTLRKTPLECRANELGAKGQRVPEMHADGSSLREIAAALGVSKSIIGAEGRILRVIKDIPAIRAMLMPPKPTREQLYQEYLEAAEEEDGPDAPRLSFDAFKIIFAELKLCWLMMCLRRRGRV